MIPFLPGRHRRSPHDDAHARARDLASQRIDEPLGSDDAAWLDRHLTGCAACTAVAAEYETQRSMLRAMPAPEPPRDLWARTRAAVELEAGPASDGRRSRRPSMVPLGALSGALVVGVVVGASLLSTPAVVQAPSAGPSSAVTPSPAIPDITPIPVAAGDVGWLSRRDDGSFALAYAPVDEVCAADSRPDCPPIDASSAGTIELAAVPRAIVASPSEAQLVVMDESTRSRGGAVYVLPVPSPGSTPRPSASPAPSRSPQPPTSPPPSPQPSPSQSPDPSPSPDPTPSTTPDGSPSAEPSPSGSPSVGPSAPPSPEPSVSPSPEPSVSPEPSPSIDPSAPIEIVHDVIVVGESAAYSSDGRWFAFAARPSDGSRGPDIFVWRVGEVAARAVTDDGRSVFSAWVGDRILGSRVVAPVVEPSPESSPEPSPSVEASPSPDGSPSPSPTIEDTVVSFLLDPETGRIATLPDAGIWRPVVDPTGRFVVFWQGTIEPDPSGLGWAPAEGRLVIAAWDASGAIEEPAPSPEPDPSAAAEPSYSAEPSPEPSSDGSPSPSASPQATASPVTSTPIPLTDRPVRDWDIRWDETGTRFAIWLADGEDPRVGTLTLFRLDPETGRPATGRVGIVEVPALPGFSIADGRLAWATPPGQDGEGSRLMVFAWSGPDAGQTRSEPVDAGEPIVVIR